MRQAQQQRPVFLPFLLLASLLACGTIQPPVLDTQPDPFLIRFDELQSAPYPSAFEAVEALRPRWIRMRSRRPVSAEQEVTVYLDDVRFGTLQSLKSVPIETVNEIEWIDPETAKERWGKHNVTAVIHVRTRR
jgi:hypothetical protein